MTCKTHVPVFSPSTTMVWAATWWKARAAMAPPRTRRLSCMVRLVWSGMQRGRIKHRESKWKLKKKNKRTGNPSESFRRLAALWINSHQPEQESVRRRLDEKKKEQKRKRWSKSI